MQILGIPFRTIPRKRTQLGIPFHAKKNRSKLSECRLNHSVEEKPTSFCQIILLLFRKTSFFLGIPFRFVSFRASELALLRNSECLGMSAFFRGITEIVPSLFRRILAEWNSVPNPILDKSSLHIIASELDVRDQGCCKALDDVKTCNTIRICYYTFNAYYSKGTSVI